MSIRVEPVARRGGLDTEPIDRWSISGRVLERSFGVNLINWRCESLGEPMETWLDFWPKVRKLQRFRTTESLLVTLNRMVLDNRYRVDRTVYIALRDGTSRKKLDLLNEQPLQVPAAERRFAAG
jgi:hypothetical protein